MCLILVENRHPLRLWCGHKIFICMSLFIIYHRCAKRVCMCKLIGKCLVSEKTVKEKLCTLGMPGAVSGNTVIKQSRVYLKSDHVWVYIFLHYLHASLFTSDSSCVPYTVYTTLSTMCICASMYVCVCLSLAWGSSSCVRVSCSKCLNSQKRKKRGSLGKSEQRAGRMGKGGKRGMNGDTRGSVANPGGSREKQRKHPTGRYPRFRRLLGWV